MKNEQTHFDKDLKAISSYKLDKGSKMKTIYTRLMTSTVSLIMTSLVTFSLPAHASDIDVYQAAKAGSVTLMFMLDNSGSMGLPYMEKYNFPGPQSACDLTSQTNYTHMSDTSTNGTPTYPRDFCQVATNNYFYKQQTTSSSPTVINWYSCGSSGSNSQSDCTVALTGTPPIVSGYSTTGSNPVYYYATSTNYYDRISRLKDGMFNLLNGNTTTTPAITPLSDDKVIGLSYFSYNGDGNTGSIVVPARSLGTILSGSGVLAVTQRQTLMNNVAKFTARNGTPTANAYSDAGAYLLGTTTLITRTGTYPVYAYYSNSSGWICQAYDSNNACTNWGGYVSLPPVPAGSVSSSSCNPYGYPATCYSYVNPVDPNSATYSGFANSSSDSKSGNNYLQPTALTSQTSNTASQTCSGQGIYVLTDGQPNASSTSIAGSAMSTALSTKGSNFDCTNSLLNTTVDNAAWSCIGNFSQALLHGTNNPSGLSIKTAVVGFGAEFKNIPSYDSSLKQDQNIANINSVASTTDQDHINAAKWGVYGGGGWYRGSSSQDVVDSVNKFIGSLNTIIPAVTTGSSTIPMDSLNTQALQPFAYFPQFQPTPDKSYQLWAGNVKKYNVSGGALTDIASKAVTDPKGNLVKGTVDLWASTASTDLKALGGLLSNLPLRDSSFFIPPVTPAVTQRKLLSNRTVDVNGVATESTTLNAITKDYITDNNTKTDPDRGYLMNLLGYKVDPAAPNAITATSLSTTLELRQMGGVMHSLPLLLTQKGSVTVDSSGAVTSTNRDDFVLFGSTQGLLHVIDASTGIEKFAFLPNEMVAKQKNAFNVNTSTSGGLANLYYGIDGPWVAYTEYVPDGSGGLTVGTGKTTVGTTNSKGKQWVYGGLRMGGKSYYSLDLTSMSSPSLKFHIDPANAASGTPLSFMGQSWSKPTIAYVKWKGARKLVMFVGGGYDAGYESDSYVQTNKQGAGVYMFDANDGSLLWWASGNASADVNTNTTQVKSVADMQYSVVSRITVADRNSDGLVDHLFFGDLGGQVWRIDLNNSLPKNNGSASTPLPFATHAVRLMNAHAANGRSPRFYDAAAFTVYKSNPTFGVVNIGSGNRSKPLASYNNSQSYIADAIYTIYDKDVATTSLYNTAQAGLITKDLTLGGTTDSTTALTKTDRNTVVGYAAAGGWYYPFTSSSPSALAIQAAKVMGDLVAINSSLYVSVFDSAAAGLSGDCGAGVKGASSINRFCLPYGKCTDGSKSADNILYMGAGIIGVTIGPGDGDVTSRTVIGGDCIDSTCSTDSNGNSNGIKVKKILTTKSKLVPVRWYEKLPKSATGN